MAVVKLYNLGRVLSDLWIYVFFLSFIYILYLLRNYIRAVILTFKLKGPPSLPILGSTHFFYTGNIYDEKLRALAETNPVMKVWISIIPFIAITEPKDIQTMLSSTKHSNKPFVYTLFNAFFGEGLIVSEFETWKQHRRIIHSAFNSNGLEKFMSIFAKHAEFLPSQFLDRLNEDINITKTINNIIYCIQAESILGLKIKKTDFTKEEDEMLPFKKNQEFAIYRLIRPWLLIDWIYKMTMTSRVDSKQLDRHLSTVCKIIKETEESMRKNRIEQEKNGKQAKEWTSLLEYLIEMKEKYPQFTDKDIADECRTFMLAGMESVSTATAIAIFLLANNKEWQEKCVDEINAILNDGNTTFTSTEALNKMKCLEMCIKETLRLYPSVPLIARNLSEDETLGGYVVPKGTNVFIAPCGTHRLSRYYSDPHSFKPQRFDPKNYDEKLHPYAYLPFSAGPRNCIGYRFAMLEIKMLVSSILRNFILEPVEGKTKVNEKYRMTLRARGGLWVRFKARTRTTHTY